MRLFLIVLGLAAVLFVVVLQASNLLPVAQPHESSVAVVNQPAVVNNSLPNVQANIPEVAAAQKPNAAIKSEPWPAEKFFVQTKDRLVAYNMASGQQRFSLPKGMLSADGKYYLVAEPFKNDQQDTSLKIFDPTMSFAFQQRSFIINGQWSLSGVSQSGRWVALTRIPSESEKAVWTKANQWKTDVQIIDTSYGQAAHTLKLDGNFEVETISSDGNSLFLIEHLPAINPDHYVIRLFDLSAERLQTGALRGKGPDEVMAGYAWEGVASPDGRWLLTLYLSTKRDVAFVHALDLRNKFPVCVDLPSGSGDFNRLKQYSLTLSPNGYKLFAANAALGIVTHISLTDFPQVVRTEHFDAHNYAAPKEDNPQAPTAHSVISQDGAKLYFTSGWDVWTYDTKAGKVDGPYLINAQIAGLGLSSDGKRLYVATTDQPLLVFDTANGSELHFPHVAVEISKTTHME